MCICVLYDERDKLWHPVAMLIMASDKICWLICVEKRAQVLSKSQVMVQSIYIMQVGWKRLVCTCVQELKVAANEGNALQRTLTKLQYRWMKPDLLCVATAVSQICTAARGAVHVLVRVSGLYRNDVADLFHVPRRRCQAVQHQLPKMCQVFSSSLSPYLVDCHSSNDAAAIRPAGTYLPI